MLQLLLSVAFELSLLFRFALNSSLSQVGCRFRILSFRCQRMSPKGYFGKEERGGKSSCSDCVAVARGDRRRNSDAESDEDDDGGDGCGG